MENRVLILVPDHRNVCPLSSELCKLLTSVNVASGIILKHIGFMWNRPSELYIYGLLIRKGFSLTDIHAQRESTYGFNVTTPHGIPVSVSDWKSFKKTLREEYKSLETAEPTSHDASKSNRFDVVQVVVMILSGCVMRKKNNYTLVKDANIPNVDNAPQRPTKKPAEGWGDRNDNTLKNVATLTHSNSVTK
ncbi:hypothetical protein LOAG_17687 [Loa loa]|uniref:Uncharacterized protein n=1 Tax=Loa loa TaxID=7209 RepID=A0A1S0UI23_LOALO|nr:hypothetical protein LOAG_17687 [Loa loa]EJD75111.1 hypothetical protein LOAG_17687 [Loa loa]